jgi:parallel beta-helix repeat protein
MKRELVLMLTLTLLIGILSVAFNVQRAKASGTIFIRVDGSIDPATAPISTLDNVTYTFADNINDSIEVERDDIIVDGAGYVVEGTGSGHGITLSGRTNVTIQNTTVRAFELGIYLSSSNNNNVLGNNVTANNKIGIWLYNSEDNVLRGNSMTNNTLESAVGLLGSNMGVGSDYGNMSDFINDVDASNTVDGKPVYYWVSETDQTVPLDAGFVVLVNCTRMKVENLTVTPNYQGILLAYTTNSTITNNNVANGLFGIYLLGCSNNSITGNILIRNSHGGIELIGSSNNSVVGNNNLDNGHGIYLYESSNCSVAGNSITAGFYGIDLFESSNNSVAGNNIANSSYGISVAGLNNDIVGNDITNRERFQGTGIELYGSSNSVVDNNMDLIKYGGMAFGISLYGSSNNFARNNVANSYVGIYVAGSSNNAVIHNNFINNTEQARSESSGTIWDDGYPSGGNYWSDYNGTDADHDGIGDTAYVIDANNADNHPLMGMFNSFNVTYYTPPIVPHACNVTVISNSTISDFVAPIWIEHPEVIFLQFNVSGAEGSTGFCRVSFPTAMMNGTYHVSVNGIEIPYTLLPFSDANYSYLYFDYTHSTQQVTIIPEFPSFLILPLFFLATLLTVRVYKRKHP